MKPLDLSDSRYLKAAVGWLELGNWSEANEELERITPGLRAHPDVLRVRYDVYAKAKKWEMAAEIAQALCRILPGDSFGWIQLAYSLHELRRTKEALNVLLPVADKFPTEVTIPYNLACYTCQLGQDDEARRWLEKAFAIGDAKELKLAALNDPDLRRLWQRESAK
jgi:tetratricopeptide (TPR) repeat protein